MPVNDFGSVGSDWNADFRMPRGWTTYPDGTAGPSSGLPDWLKQLIPSPGAATPNAPGLPGGGVGPGGAYMPGGGVMGLPAATPGAPSMGFPAQGGPEIIPPQNSTIPPNKSVGPFTGGTSTENGFDPRSWFRANPGATFQAGQPMGPDVTGGGGWPPGLSTKTTIDIARRAGGGNPYAAAALAAAGVMQPTPAGGPDAPTNLWMQRPSGVGGMPGPQVTNPAYDPLTSIRAPGAPIDRNHPLPWQPSTTPTGTPSATPRPSGTPYPPRRPKTPAPAAAAPSSNPRFGLYQPQVPGSGQGGPLSRSPIYTTLNLFGARS